MTILDVMVVWSNQTQAAAGAGMPAFAQQCIDISNTVYANSGINPRLRLVYAGPIAYDEDAMFTANLNWVSSDPTVAALRNTYGADFVALIVENSQYCGFGWIGPAAGSIFTVINRGCAVGNLSFPHELGHNMGCLHNPETDQTPGYNHGYNPAALGIAGWRDVMSYAPGSRQAVLSNPLIQWNGIPAGTAELHDAARVINDNAAQIAAYRAEVVVSPTLPPPSGLPASASGTSVPPATSVSDGQSEWTLGEVTQYGKQILRDGSWAGALNGQADLLVWDGQQLRVRNNTGAWFIWIGHWIVAMGPPPPTPPSTSGPFTGTVPAGSSFRVVDGLVVGYP